MNEQRKLWLQTRRTGIGGSDAAAILGMSPWKSQMDVWLEKRGLVEQREDDPDRDFLLDLGNLMEPVLADLYCRETKRQIKAGELVRHPTHPVLLGTPDRICIGEARGVELKTENQFSDMFGDPGTDEVPHHYLIQCAHYMAITGLPVWDVAVLHGGSRFSIYTIHRDLELEQSMIDQLLGWWDAHIIRGTPPDVDSSEAWRIYLHKKHPSELLPIKELMPEHYNQMERLAQIRHAERVIAALRDEAENKLKSIIGDHAGIYSPYGNATWKKTKDTKVVDWQSAYIALRRNAVDVLAKIAPEFKTTSEKFDALAEKCLEVMTHTRPGVRRFLFTPPKRGPYGDNKVVEIRTASGADPTSIAANIARDSEHGPGGSGESGN